MTDAGLSATRPASDADIDAQIKTVAEDLRETLSAVAVGVTGAAIRPARLVRDLGIDKSLASRLARGLRASTAYELIHFLPAPTGLRIYLRAAAQAGVPRALTARAERAVDAFQALLDGLPGGRAALDTLISASVAEVRDRSERSAKQAVYRGMSTLLGFHCDAITSTLIFFPSERSDRVDAVEVSQRRGIRRLRPSTPVALFSVAMDVKGEADGELPVLETIDGGRNVRDPRRYLLPGHSSDPLPDLDLIEENGHLVFGLSDDTISLHHPVTVASILVVRRGWPRYRDETAPDAARTYLLHYPCKRVVREVYVHDEIYVGANPDVRFEFPSPRGSRTARPTGKAARLNTLDVVCPIEQLGVGITRGAVPGLPGHAEMVRDAFALAGLDATRFRGYRTDLAYPVPMTTMGWWIPVPERR